VEELPLLGATASNLTGWSAKELRLPSRDGARVRGVRSGGPADQARPALREDDIVVSVDGVAVKDVRALRQALEDATRAREGHAQSLVAFERGGERLLTVVELGRAGLEDPGLEARKAWVPIAVQVVTPELADKLGIAGRQGVRITRLLNGAAQAAGLRVGDVITAIDGDPVEASQPSDAELFAAMVRQYKIGSRIELTLVRDGREQKAPVVLEASPRVAREMKKYEDPNFEFRVRDVAPADRLVERMPESEGGVLVDAVSEGGWAALGHLADGDLLLTIDGEPVADVEAVQRKMARIFEAKPASVVFKVRRGIRTFFVELQTGWQGMGNGKREMGNGKGRMVRATGETQLVASCG
jgi:S1-C subfamily serine protease